MNLTVTFGEGWSIKFQARSQSIVDGAGWELGKAGRVQAGRRGRGGRAEHRSGPGFKDNSHAARNEGEGKAIRRDTCTHTRTGHSEDGTTRKVGHLSRELSRLGAWGACYARSTEPMVAGP